MFFIIQDINLFYFFLLNKRYNIKICQDENLREMVVYQDTTKEDLFWVRPLDLFLSEVDHDKYPNVKQKYRFELLD